MATFLHRAETRDALTDPTTPLDGGDLISVSSDHGCAIRADQTLACWGDNTHGQASPPPGAYTDIAVDTNYSCAIRADGQVACWGDGTDGRTTPPAGVFTAVTANFEHPCGVRADGTIACWGESHTSYPGGGSTDRPPSGAYTDISLSQYVGCGIRTDQSIQCWGWTSGTLGMGPSPQGTFTAVDVTHRRACALRSDATITCWGNAVETLRSPPAGSHIDISVGGSYDGYSCALRTDQTITCWGEDTVALPHRAGEQPTVIAGLTSPPSGRYQDLALTNHHACALRGDNTHTCWGSLISSPAEELTVTLSPSILSIAEGRTLSYFISLNAEPAAPITIRIEVPAGSDLTVSRSSIVFDESNWNTRQEIDVTAAQDDDTVWDNTEGIRHTLSSTEPVYRDITVPTLTVVVRDDDTSPILEPPEPPSDVVVDWQEGTSITVTWQPSASHGPGVSYGLEFLVQPSQWPYYEFEDIGPKVTAPYRDRLREDFFGTTSIALLSPSTDLASNNDGTLTTTIYTDPARNAASYVVNLNAIEGVRVVARNSAGFSVSDAVEFTNERVARIRRERDLLRGLVKNLVDDYGDEAVWLADVWSYITSQEQRPWPLHIVYPKLYGTRYQGFGFTNHRFLGPSDEIIEIHAGGAFLAPCAEYDPNCGYYIGAGIQVLFDPTGMATAISPRHKFGATWIAIHELAHIYSLASRAPRNRLAVAAGLMYMQELVLADPQSDQLDPSYVCSAHELYADIITQATLMVMFPDNTVPAGTYLGPPDGQDPWSSTSSYLDACGLQLGANRWGPPRWPTEHVDLVWETLGGTVPAWFEATYKRSDGSWDRDKMCATVLSMNSSPGSHPAQGSGSAAAGYILSEQLGIDCGS